MMKTKLLFAIFLIAISSFRHNHAKSLKVTKITETLPVTFPGQKILTTEKRVIIKQLEFKCPGPGAFANDHNCEEYYECDEQGKATLVKCEENKLWSDKVKACTDPLQSTCATLKVITRNITNVESATHVSRGQKVLYRLVGDKLGDGQSVAVGNGYNLIKRIKLVPTEQIELLFVKEQVPKELIEYYEKIKSQVPSYFLEIYESQQSYDQQRESTIELVNLYKSRALRPLQLIQYYVKFQQIPKELIVYYQKHPVQFENDEQRKQLGRSTEEEILEDLVNKKLIIEQLFEIYIKLGQLPEKVVLWIQENSQITDASNEMNKDVSILIDNYQKNLLKPIHLVKYFIAHKELPKELIVYYHKNPMNLESEEVRVQLTRLSLEQILEDMKSNKLLTSQLIEFYIKEKQFPEQIITWFQNKNEKPDDGTMGNEGDKSINPDQLLEWYKQNSLKPLQLIQYYLFAHTIPQQLIVYYQQNPPQFETEEQRKQLTRISIEEIIEDFKANRLLPAQLIELFVKVGKIPREIIALFETNNEPNTEVVVDEQDQVIIEAYKTNKLTLIELIKYYLKNRKLPEQLIIYYQKHPPQLESEEQKNLLTRLTIEEIIEDLQKNRLLPAQLISFYIKQGEFPQQMITIFEEQIRRIENGGEVDEPEADDTNKPKEGNGEELIELYKTNKLDPFQLIQFYITKQVIPQELIVYYQKHPPQFETEEQKIQLTRLSIEEILEDLKNKKLHPAQLIEFYLKQGNLAEEIIAWFKKHGQTSPESDETIDPNQLIEIYQKHELKPSQLIQYYITYKQIPEQLIVYYQKHRPTFDTEEQKIQLTRLSIEEILEDLKNKKLLPEQIIELYLKQGQIDQQIITWFKEHNTENVEPDTVPEIDPVQLIEMYKQKTLKPVRLIEYFIATKKIPQELIVYYQKHPIEYTEEEKIQLTRLSIEEILEDLKGGRLLLGQLIEFYLKQGNIPDQVVVWYQKHRNAFETMNQTKEGIITKEKLIDNYKNNVLKTSSLIEFFISKHTIPQEFIVYYQEHPIEYSEEQKIRLTRLTIEEILEDLKGGRLLPAQLIEFYLKQGTIPEEVVVWYQKHKTTQVVITEEQLIENYKNNVLKPFQLIEFFITKHTIPQELIVYYQKHPLEYTEEQKVQLTRLSIEEILEDMKGGRLLLGQLINFYIKQGTIPKQIITWYVKHKPNKVPDDGNEGLIGTSEGQLFDKFKKHVLKPTQLIEFFITKHTIPQELIVYYQKHRSEFETEEQKVQLTRLTIEEIMEDLKSGRLILAQLIEFYLKQGTIPEQVVVWYQEHRPSGQVVVKPEVDKELIEKYKEHTLDPVLLIQYYLTTNRLPQQFIIYYKQHPELISQEELRRIRQFSVEQIIDDLNNNRLHPGELIEFFMRRGYLPKQVIDWFKKNRPNEVTDAEQVAITKLIKNYKNHVLTTSQLIGFFYTQRTIPQELIIYYQKHPPTFESEKQRIQLTRLTIEEILEDLKNGRLIPAQLIEFYLKQGTIPGDVIKLWYQKHRPVVKPDGTLESNILIELLKRGKLQPGQFIEYYIENGQIPEDFLVYYQQNQISKDTLTKEERYQLKRLELEQILEDLETKRLIISQLIEFYIREKRLPDQVILTYQKLKLRPVRPDPDSQTPDQCKAYFSEGDDELELGQLCGASCSTDTFTIAHPKSHKKYIVCNLQINRSVKHVIRKCSHGLVFDKVYRTCEKQSVVDQCSGPVGSPAGA